MIFVKFPLADASAVVDPIQYDSIGSHASIGGTALSRNKRKGRNPSTGARTSRPYGLSTIFLTGIAPLANSESVPLY